MRGGSPGRLWPKSQRSRARGPRAGAVDRWNSRIERVYKVEGDDRVLPLSGVPAPDVGAPLPVVLSDEGNLLVAYIAHEPDPNWDGTYVRIVGPGSGGALLAIVAFERKYCHMFGKPNDEAFHGHPLYARGLRPYSAAEVAESSWIRAMERMNSVHPNHQPEHYENFRHFIIAFHDSTFECIAMGFQVTMHRGSMQSAFAQMAKMLCDDWDRTISDCDLDLTMPDGD